MTKFLKAASIFGTIVIALSLCTANVVGEANSAAGSAYSADLAHIRKTVDVTSEMIEENEMYNKTYIQAFEEAFEDEFEKYDFKTWEYETTGAYGE